MACVIAADDEWRSRKVLASFDCQPAVTEEKPPAEGLKHGATGGRRQEHAFRFARASHGSAGVASALFPIFRSRLPDEDQCVCPNVPTEDATRTPGRSRQCQPRSDR